VTAVEDTNQAENINTEELQTDIQELFQAYIIDRIQNLIANSEAQLIEQQKKISDEIKKLSPDAGIIKVLDELKVVKDNTTNMFAYTTNMFSDTVEAEKAALGASLTTIYQAVNDASNTAKEEHNSALQQHSKEILLNRTLLLDANNTCASISSQIEALKTQLSEINVASQTADTNLLNALGKLCTSKQFAIASEQTTNVNAKFLTDLQKANDSCATITRQLGDLKIQIDQDGDASKTANAALQDALSKLCSSEQFAAASTQMTNTKKDLLTELQKASRNTHTTITSEIEALKIKLSKDYAAVQSATTALQDTIHTGNDTSTARLEVRIDTLQRQLSAKQNLLFRLLLISGFINIAGIIALIILLVS
jgi:hypothetical protein